MPGPLLTAIDVGTTKTIALIAQVSPDAGLELLGTGIHPSTGLRKGLVIDPERTARAVREAVTDAEKVAGERVQRAIVGVTGSHLRTHPAKAEVTVANPDKGVSATDLKRLDDLVTARDFGGDRRLVTALTQGYQLDGETGIQDPLGRPGHRLKVETLLISGDVRSLDVLAGAVQQAGIVADELYLQAVASAEAVLSHDERQQGTVLVDIGGGTSDVVVYYNGVPVYTFVIPVGGDHFDSDLAYAFDLTTEQAEWVKVEHASIQPAAFTSEAVIRLPWAPTRTGVLAAKLVPEVAWPRAKELSELLRQELERSQLLPHLRGCVLTGGGSQLHGLIAMVGAELHLPTRLGEPTGIIGRLADMGSPSLATGIGLLRLGEQRWHQQQQASAVIPVQNPLSEGFLGLLKRKFRDFLDGLGHD